MTLVKYFVCSVVIDCVFLCLIVIGMLECKLLFLLTGTSQVLCLLTVLIFCDFFLTVIGMLECKLFFLLTGSSQVLYLLTVLICCDFFFNSDRYA